MVKQRMSTADIAAEIGCLRQKGLIGMRVVNVYDISPKVGQLSTQERIESTKAIKGNISINILLLMMLCADIRC